MEKKQSEKRVDKSVKVKSHKVVFKR
jgi:hypothetical protein